MGVADPSSSYRGAGIWANQAKSTLKSHKLHPNVTCNDNSFLRHYGLDWNSYLYMSKVYHDSTKCHDLVHNLLNNHLELIMKIMKYCQDGTSQKYQVSS